MVRIIRLRELLAISIYLKETNLTFMIAGRWEFATIVLAASQCRVVRDGDISEGKRIVKLGQVEPVIDAGCSALMPDREIKCFI